VAYDATLDAVWVACAGGELIALPAAGGDPLVNVRLPRDLRDVVVQKGGLVVTRFRTADVLYVTRAGDVDWTLRVDRDQLFSNAAWRATPWSDGNVAIVHQRARVLAPGTSASNQYYAPPPPPTIGQFDQQDQCNGAVVEPTITVVGPSSLGLVSWLPDMPEAVLPVDAVLAPGGATYAIAAAGNAYTNHRATVYLGAVSDWTRCAILEPIEAPPGEAIAIAYAGSELLVQMRDPAVLYFTDAKVAVQLSDVRRRDTGHAIFHANSGHGIACASCHLEGGEDGVTWDLPSGTRRTPSLRGTLHGTAPYHWQGEFGDLGGLFRDVMSTRMGGPKLSEPTAAALSAWLERLPAPPPLVPQDPDAVARGRALFESAAVGCTTCHSGPLFTDNRTIDVGTGAPFQVPSLVGVGWRAPYLHDGSAANLFERFVKASDAHGHTKDLRRSDLDALIAYLETL
jgi:cytochrome c peroxidase